MEAVIERASLYLEAGADGIFLEAVTDLNDYKIFKEKLNTLLLANITEFGKTPLFSKDELAGAGVDMSLYPLSAFRAMSLASEKVYESLLKEGTQRNVLDIMQTREELYERLNYHEFEQKLDKLFSDEGEK
jgi:methylisocitrate lyase